MMNEINKESAFLVTNASGRHINLLNDNEHPSLVLSPPSSEISEENLVTESITEIKVNNNKRKYHCTEPGCTKSFTTSGHLARHNRIHTGEKNFPCLFPGCLSRFSRQDNMMQHYRTHMSPKSKRTQKKIISEELHPRPKLHAHQRIRSDPYQTERPLTIDQHLSNYRQSLLYHSNGSSFNMPTPIGSVATVHLQKHHKLNNGNVNMSAFKPILIKEDKRPSTTVADVTFYQHKPLIYSKEARKAHFPYTLLHPTNLNNNSFTPSFNLSTPSTTITTVNHNSNNEEKEPTTTNSTSNNNDNNNNNNNNNNSSQSGLLQLAHIVSTFG